LLQIRVSYVLMTEIRVIKRYHLRI